MLKARLQKNGLIKLSKEKTFNIFVLQCVSSGKPRMSLSSHFARSAIRRWLQSP